MNSPESGTYDCTRQPPLPLPPLLGFFSSFVFNTLNGSVPQNIEMIGFKYQNIEKKLLSYLAASYRATS